LDDERSSLPGHILIQASGNGRNADAAYLGPRYASVVLADGKPPRHTERPKGLDEAGFRRRNELQRRINDRFALRRRTAETDAYTQSYDQALEMMRQRDVFDLSKESDKDKERYGSHDFGRHCLMARRLLEHGITYVQVTHSNYDTHNENFNFHFEQLSEFDGPFATLVQDLVDRGLWDSTLLVVLSEFGRTPKINRRYGRDHWGKSWSMCLGGAGIQRGALIGATNEKGTEVTEREVDTGHLFHTYLRALGLKSQRHFKIDGRNIPMADPAFEPIKELLA